jgi:hypothetical protein
VSDYGVDSSGFVAPRAADFSSLMRDGVDAELADRGLPTIDWDSDLTFSVFIDVVSVHLGDLAEAAQGLHDAGNPNNATGVHADDIGSIRGVPRRDATQSTATVTLGGTAGTIVVEGKKVRGGGEDGTAVWELTEDCTIPGDVIVQAVEAGATLADPTEISEIVTPVAGWTSVTNAAAATPGRQRETDAEYLARQARSLANQGSGTLAAIQARLLQLDYVQGAYVVNNRSASVASVQGLSLQPHSVSVVLYPSTLTDDQKADVAELLYRHVDPGTYLNGTVTSQVVRGDGYEETVRWSWASTLTVNVAIVVVLETGYELADVETPIDELVTEWWAENARLGQAIDDIDLECEIADEIDGVRRVTVTLNSAAFVAPDADEFPTLGTITTTEAP